MQQFKSMNDLVEYLGNLEERIKKLESENASVRTLQPSAERVDGNVIARYVSRSLPQTNLLSVGFLRRAFAVWGHFFVANLIISVVVGIAYACLMMVLFGSMFGSLLQQGK